MRMNGTADTGIRLAKAGYAVYGMDYEGHGKSSGLQGHVPNFDALVTDCSDHFTSICGMFKSIFRDHKFEIWFVGGRVSFWWK